LSRKQRELADRHSLFLSIAREKVHSYGFHALTMEQVAEQAEYSKGTLYQHFCCKEELLIQLSIQALEQMHRLAVQATEYDGSNREKLIAFIVAHECWQNVLHCDVQMLQNIHNDSVLEKVPAVSLEKYQSLEFKIIDLACNIFQRCIDNNELSNIQFKAIELVYGLWSMCYGGQLLRSYKLPLKQMGMENPGSSIINLAQLMLDGLQLQPSMSHQQTHLLVKNLESEYFADTLKQMQSLAALSNVSTEDSSSESKVAASHSKPAANNPEQTSPDTAQPGQRVVRDQHTDNLSNELLP